MEPLNLFDSLLAQMQWKITWDLENNNCRLAIITDDLWYLLLIYMLGKVCGNLSNPTHLKCPCFQMPVKSFWLPWSKLASIPFVSKKENRVWVNSSVVESWLSMSLKYTHTHILILKWINTIDAYLLWIMIFK